MKRRDRSLLFSLRRLAVYLHLFVLLCLCGCARYATRSVVLPLPNREVIALEPDDIVRIMRRAGFEEKEILKLGTALRNYIATQGAAQIRIGDRTEAIFGVSGGYVHVSGYRRGGFVYDVQRGAVFN